VHRLICLAALIAICGSFAEARTRRRTVYRFQATAFARHGITASGTPTHVGIAAADPDVLPIGTRIRVSGAGPYSGVYTITDVGGKVDGRHIDLFVPNRADARRFGRKMVTVRILKRGSGEIASSPGTRPARGEAARSSR
jgi:3D (Asp-Asp-Asp) domain-containing protein